MRPFDLFSRDAATLYERVSVRWLVGPSVGPLVGNAFVFRPTRSDKCRVYGPFTCSLSSRLYKSLHMWGSPLKICVEFGNYRLKLLIKWIDISWHSYEATFVSLKKHGFLLWPFFNTPISSRYLGDKLNLHRRLWLYLTLSAMVGEPTFLLLTYAPMSAASLYPQHFLLFVSPTSSLHPQHFLLFVSPTSFLPFPNFFYPIFFKCVLTYHSKHGTL